MTFEALGNVFQGWRGVGGKITVTTRRLLFTPNRVDGATDGRPVVLDRAEVHAAAIVPGKQSSLRVLGLAPRRPVVRVDHADGPMYFMVNKPDQLTTALKKPP